MIQSKLVAVLLALLTAAAETFGAYGAGLVWVSGQRQVVGFFYTFVGFGLSIIFYIIMRKFVTDLAVAQAFFIGSAALLSVAMNFYAGKIFNMGVVVGILLIALGAIIVDRALV